MNSVDHDWDLVDATRLFWWDLMRSEPENYIVSDHLSPYCRIQEDFGDAARGLIGRDGCLVKLRDIKSSIIMSGLDSKMHHMKIMPNGSETRFILYGKVPISQTITKDATLGVAIEWHGGIVTCLTVIRNVDIKQFMDGEISHERASMCSANFSEVGALSETNFDSPSVEATDFSYRDTSVTFMGYNLRPPYRVSRPLAVPPTVSVVVLGCENLRSRLIRVVPRPMNSKVTVRVGQIAQTTQIVRDTCDPEFSKREDDPFVFQIPEAHLTNGYIEFIIDEVHVNDTPLAIARIPFAALPLKDDTSLPHDMFVPLQLLPSYMFRMPPDVRISRVSKIGLYDKERHLHMTSPGPLTPVLKVIIAKVDIMQWWATQEIRERDIARNSTLVGLERDTSCTLPAVHSMRVEHAMVGFVGSSDKEISETSVRIDEEDSDEDEDLHRRSVRWITSADMW